MSTAEELERLVALRDRGVLSEEEFQAEKARLLGHATAAGPLESPLTEPLFPQPPGSSDEATAPRFAASPPTAPVPPTPSSDPTGNVGGNKRGSVVPTAKQVLIGLVILVVIATGAGLGVALTGNAMPATSASEVFLQPTNAQGKNPFTPNVGTDASVPPTVSSALTPTSGTSLASYSGNSVGLYGGTLNQSSCNPQQMITYLAANPAKASAWAAAEGISVSQISAYIGALTPMTLRYDTRVTNHGYVNGQANAIPEILQAGQAVLVDSHGVPRARCYCGNPLTPPIAVAGSPRYVGPQWSGFSPSTTIVVTQSTTTIDNFTLINNSTGQAFSRPTGTTGISDTPAPTCNNGPSMPGVTVCTNPTTTVPPTTTTTVPPTTTTTTTTAPTTAPFTLSDLDAAVAAQWQSSLGSSGTVECLPPSVSLAIGTYIFCGMAPSVGGYQGVIGVIQITGDTPSSFTDVAGPDVDILCSSLNAAEQAAFTAAGTTCDHTGSG